MHDPKAADHLGRTTPPAANPTGAAIFYLYILLALVLTFLIVADLARQSAALFSSPASAPSARSEQRSKRCCGVLLFATLAASGFAVLSFNMLHVLVRSYRVYYRGYDGVVGDGVGGWVGRVWVWSTRERLFYGFARGVFKGGEEGREEEEVVRFWTGLGLVGTWVVGLVIAGEGRAEVKVGGRGGNGLVEMKGRNGEGVGEERVGGRDDGGKEGEWGVGGGGTEAASAIRRGLTEAEVERKRLVEEREVGLMNKSNGIGSRWMFHFLAQILPPSFALNLFFIALILQRARHSKDKPTAQTSRPADRTGSGYFENLTTPSAILGHSAFILYIYLISIGPEIATHGSTSELLTVVLAARFLLLFVGLTQSYFLASDSSTTVTTTNIILPAALYGTAASFYHLWTLKTNFGVSAKDLLHALLFNHPAVSTLGCDFVLCVLSFGAWYALGLSDGTKA